jgi:curved DNA-binding protein CbpA
LEIQVTASEKFREAYRLMNLEELSSPEVIRQAYGELTRRWDPDQYPEGSSEHTHAADRLKCINEAYTLIADAPLRSPIQLCEMPKPIESDLPLEPDGNDVKPGRPDGFEYCVRFGFGALLGALFAAKLFFSRWISIQLNPSLHWSWTEVFAAAGIVLVCGLLSARYGDSFWFRTLGREGRLGRGLWY